MVATLSTGNQVPKAKLNSNVPFLIELATTFPAFAIKSWSVVLSITSPLIHILVTSLTFLPTLPQYLFQRTLFLLNYDTSLSGCKQSMNSSKLFETLFIPKSHPKINIWPKLLFPIPIQIESGALVSPIRVNSFSII